MYDEEEARRLADPQAIARIRNAVELGMVRRPRRRRLAASLIGLAAALLVAGSGAAAYAAYTGAGGASPHTPSQQTPLSYAEPDGVGERHTAWEAHVAVMRAQRFLQTDAVGGQVRWGGIGVEPGNRGLRVEVTALTPTITPVEVEIALEAVVGMPVAVAMQAYGDTSHDAHLTPRTVTLPEFSSPTPSPSFPRAP